MCARILRLIVVMFSTLGCFRRRSRAHLSTAEKGDKDVEGELNNEINYNDSNNVSQKGVKLSTLWAKFLTFIR
jgi:hypothetical protein